MQDVGLHPASAIVAGAFILWLLWRAVFTAQDVEHRRLGIWLAGLLGFQFLLGGLDVLLRAPVWMQVLAKPRRESLCFAILLKSYFPEKIPFDM